MKSEMRVVDAYLYNTVRMLGMQKNILRRLIFIFCNLPCQISQFNFYREWSHEKIIRPPEETKRQAHPFQQKVFSRSCICRVKTSHWLSFIISFHRKMFVIF